MKKRFLFLLLAIGLTSVAYTDYLDDWPDDALCGWMDNPSPPSYMVEEVNNRGVSCSGGVAINNLPDPPIEPPIVPPIDPPIRPGWKILEGTDMLVINDEDPYWQTEEGLIERPPKIDPGIEYAPETVPGADPRIPAPPVVDKPPSDPNPPPILDDPTVLQPVDPGIQGDVEITEAPAPVPTQRPDMFSAAAVKYANTVTAWAEAGIPAAITKKYLNDPTAGGKCDHECQMNAPTDPNYEDPNPPPKIDPGIEYAPETVPGADPRIPAPPVVDKPPSDPNPPPILDDPTVLQPVDPG